MRKLNKTHFLSFVARRRAARRSAKKPFMLQILVIWASTFLYFLSNTNFNESPFLNFINTRRPQHTSYACSLCVCVCVVIQNLIYRLEATSTNIKREWLSLNNASILNLLTAIFYLETHLYMCWIQMDFLLKINS